MRPLSGRAGSATPALLELHLQRWLGGWPPRPPVEVVEDQRRVSAGWDGQQHPFLGVGSSDGVDLSVAPGKGRQVEAAVAGLPIGGAAFLDALTHVVGERDRPTVQTVFRWCTDPTPSDDVGVWLDRDDPDVPDWLHPFSGRVLVARDAGGNVVSGVGVKRHDSIGHELAVVTTSAARGQGLAAALVAQAARSILSEDGLPTYLHLATNTASAHVAESAGFADRGWIGLALQDR